jgi:hypothetical protein
VSCAFKHSSSRDIAGLTVDLKEGNATACEMLRTSFERIVRSRRRDGGSFSLSMTYRDCRRIRRLCCCTTNSREKTMLRSRSFTDLTS